ncbi:SLC13 family permease [Branchiibius sp. NY16-3462-2]|uniref:SLC13 family permease n=1 Tax=Branchiibius sp. NY16-3462-2 TaxID=1807500 RepID=UPI000795ACC8|nr:SLC13 family permease [Branchiibius sp. NY16-3462-2]KYH44211.1 di-/tricarboxylate transporter [Branchiibius sp. NY16-3462-2]
MAASTTTFVILVVAVAVFIWNKLPPSVVALGVALALYLTGVLTLGQTVAGFGDPLIIYIASLFVISEALDATGVTAFAGQQLMARTGTNPRSVVLGLMLLVAVLTAAISVNGSVTALVPVGVILATRIRQAPSKLLMPMAFAAHAGSLLTLLGSPINLLVSEVSQESGSRPFGFFEFALAGIPLVVGTFAINLFLGPKVLPVRTPRDAPNDLSRYAELMAREYDLASEDAAISYHEGLKEIVIPPRSSFIGEHVYVGMPMQGEDLFVVALRRGGSALENGQLQAGDILVVRGGWSALDEHLAEPDVVSVAEPEQVRRQSGRFGVRTYLTLAIVIPMAVLLAIGAAPPAIIVLGAAVLLVALKALTREQAQSAIQLPTLITIAGMIPLSTAIQTSGAADLISDRLVSTFGDSPRLLLIGVVVVVLILGQFISNLATALIVAPIAVAVSQNTHTSPLPMLMAIAVAAAAAFLTPVATPANLMIQEPAGYRFGDYWRLGLPNLIFFGAVAAFLVPVIWSF